MISKISVIESLTENKVLIEILNFFKYDCLTTTLKPDNLTILDFYSPQNGRDYKFEPDLAILQSGTGHVTSIQPIKEPTVIRNRPAWKWSARINKVYSYVYYSIPKDGEISGNFQKLNSNYQCQYTKI